MASIVIPAHNEANVIEKTLRALICGMDSQEVEIVVVCNGCSDQTGMIARNVGGSITRIIETPTAGKCHALNIGDQASLSFPRIYLDADVLLSGEAATKLLQRLGHGDKLAVAPTASFDLIGCSWTVRAYYLINSMLPSSREGLGGSGVYALSAAGRKRFGEFPPVIADDGFVRIHFTPSERETLPDCFSTVFPPKTLVNLIRIKTRSHIGNRQLQRAFPHLWPNKGPGNAPCLRRLWRKPSLWAPMTVYCGVKVAVRAIAHFKRLFRSQEWGRDNSSRSRESSKHL